jgi:Clostripain family
MGTIAKWTLMVYLAGDNNLASAGDADLAEMRTVGSSADVNIVAQFDSAIAGGAKRFLLKPGGRDEQIENLGKIDSGAPETLTDFIGWATKHYPAERYALVLWNHGSGWEPSEMDKIARSVGTPNYHSREAIERSASGLRRVMFRTTLEKILRLPSPSERAICSDDNSGHSLDTIELGSVLSRAVKSLGKPFDLLGMDACLMSNLEVAYQVKPFVRYMVASEELEPSSGWPYDLLLRKFVDHPDLPTAELGDHIVRVYIKSYVDRGYAGPVTQAALDLEKVADLTTPIDSLAQTLIAEMPQAATELWNAQRKSAHFYQNTLWDIAHLCEVLEESQGGAQVIEAAKAVRDAIEQGPEKCIIAAENHGDPVSRCGGVSVYLIPPLTRISPFYGDLDFAEKNAWPKLLQAYHSA